MPELRLSDPTSPPDLGCHGYGDDDAGFKVAIKVEVLDAEFQAGDGPGWQKEEGSVTTLPAGTGLLRISNGQAIAVGALGSRMPLAHFARLAAAAATETSRTGLAGYDVPSG